MTRQRRETRGVSLIELLVVVAILGLLIALVIPAVQAARESARRGECASNLRQFGIALNSYEATYGVVPMTHNGRGYSPHVVLLPLMEQRQLFDSINMMIAMDGSTPAENSTSFGIGVGLFHCPSDSPSFEPNAWTSYAGNRGVGYNEAGALNNGLFNQPTRSGPVAIGDIKDGSSNTSAFSEWVAGPQGGRPRNPNEAIYQANSTRVALNFDDLIAGCRTTAEIPAIVTGKGLYWMHGDQRSTLYNHTMVVNDKSCLNGGAIQKSAWTAGSRHNGGANLVFADGHLAFIKTNIDGATWRALATRSGGEVIQTPQ